MMDAAQDRAAVTAVLQAYFDGLRHSDVEGLRAIFWPEANLYTAAGGAVTVEPREAWLKRVAGRPNFAAQGIETPGEIGPFGARGIGEHPLLGVAPAASVTAIVSPIAREIARNNETSTWAPIRQNDAAVEPPTRTGPARFTGSGGFDSCVEGQQVGLF